MNRTSYTGGLGTVPRQRPCPRAAGTIATMSPGRVFRRSALPDPPVALSAEGSTIRAADGHEYLDAAGGAIVVNVGHGRREIARVMAEQAGQLAYAHGSVFTTEPLEAYAAEVAAVLPVDDPAIYPVSGGSEAIETALKLARAYHLARGEPEREILVARHGSYHGNTLGALDLSGRPPLAPAVRAMAGPVPARVGRVPVPRRRPGGARPRRRERARGRARAGVPGARSGAGGGVRRRADRRGHARRGRPARRLLAGHRRDVRPPRRAAHRRRGDDRLRAHGPLVRARSLGRPAGPAGRREGRHVGLLAVRVRGGIGTGLRDGHRGRGPASSTASRSRIRRSGRRSRGRCCASSTTRTWSRRVPRRASDSSGCWGTG